MKIPPIKIDDHEYHPTVDSLVSVLIDIQTHFEDAQSDVPYSTLRQRNVVDTRGKQMADLLRYLHAVLFELKKLP
jgi:hypothetical protein